MGSQTTMGPLNPAVQSREPGPSFRDPGGTVLHFGGRVFRFLNEKGAADLESFLGSGVADALINRGQVVKTWQLGKDEVDSLAAHEVGGPGCDGAQMVVEHERVPFVSYPYEWPPEMLHAAAKLTIEIALQLLDAGMGLKDGTPYNVLFRGPNPVFVDVSSFERREPGDPTWLAYAQFTRTFLLPLLAHRQFGMSLDQVLLMRRDGLEPEELYGWLSWMQRIRSPFLSAVSLPVWLGARHDRDDDTIYRRKTLRDPEQAKFVLGSTLRRLGRILRGVAPSADSKSTWSDYLTANNNYTPVHFKAKEDFIDRTLREFRPRRVLDIGCNTGHFSAMAARGGARVVAVDYDPVVVGRVWRWARQEKLDIVPLVVNLTRPTPGMGWRGRECSSFLDRASGAFDLVLMLAVLHHILVTERVPLREVISLAAELTSDLLLIEFIGSEDSMFKRLVRGRDELYRGLTVAAFEAEVQRRFLIVQQQHVEGTDRRLYLLRKQ